jgi:hypothetical protein
MKAVLDRAQRRLRQRLAVRRRLLVALGRAIDAAVPKNASGNNASVR